MFDHRFPPKLGVFFQFSETARSWRSIAAKLRPGAVQNQIPLDAPAAIWLRFKADKTILRRHKKHWMFLVLVDIYNLKWWCNHTDDIWFLEWYYSWVSCDQIGSNLVSKWLWFKWCLDKKLVYGVAGTKWMFTPQNVALMLKFPDRITVLPQVIFIRRDNYIL